MPKPASDKSSAGICSHPGCISDRRRTVLRITLAAIAVLILFSLAAAPASAGDTWDGTTRTAFGGGGSPENPYIIDTCAKLAYLAQQVNDGISSYENKYFKVTEDLDLNSKQWTPIGTDHNKPFKGTFDGAGHTISGLYINAPIAHNQGLFGYTGSGANITNLGVTGGSVSSDNDNVGGLVGYNTGTIENCSSTVTVNGNKKVGGLAGENYQGTITNCYATGSVKGNENVGGLVGYNNAGDSGTATITNCYATGTVTGTSDWRVGGLVGQNYGGTITNSYATGTVTGINYVGGLAGGTQYGGTITNSVALNPSVSATASGAKVGRVVGDGVCSNCYAWEGMTNEPLSPSLLPSGGKNGADASSESIWLNKTGLFKTLGWVVDSGVGTNWRIDDNVGQWPLPYLITTPQTKPAYSTTIEHLKPLTVTYDGNGNTDGTVPVDPKRYTKNKDTVTVLGNTGNLQKTGYTFAGWKSEAGINYNVGATFTIKSDTTLYANWTANPDAGYTVKHYKQNLENNEYPADPAETESLTGTIGTNTAAEAKTYDGFTNKTFNQETIAGDGSTIVRIEYNRILYPVTFNSDGGSAVDSQNVKYEGHVNNVDSTKAGYTLEGWYNGTAKWNFASDTVTSAITLYAKWTPAGTPTPKPQSGGSTDTGSGHYTNYERTASNGGHVSFGTSPIVTAVDMPEGVTGSVELITVVVTDTDGREFYATFEINAPESADGERSLIYFQLDLQKIEAEGYTVKDVVLSHKNEDGTWTDLKTTYLGTEDGKAKYSAENTVGYSVFAIYYTEGASLENTEPAVTAVVPTAEPEQTYVEPAYVEPTKTAEPVQTKSPAGLVGLGLGLLGAFAVIRRK